MFNIRTSYDIKDVTVLLKDLTDSVIELSPEEYQQRKCDGEKYYTMIQKEELPDSVMEYYYSLSLICNAEIVASLVVCLGDKIYRRYGDKIVLASLLRAGTPIGILLKRYLEQKYDIEVPHYSISIIRGFGIDTVALNYVHREHQDSNIVFVDGWTGKGVIKDELVTALTHTPIEPVLAVLVDVIGCSDLYGTRRDVIVPSAFLNSIVSGLFSRSLLMPNGRHGAIYYDRFSSMDKTYSFIDDVLRCINNKEYSDCSDDVIDSNIILALAKEYTNNNTDRIKPGLNETIRAFEKNSVKILLVSSRCPSIIFALARELNVTIVIRDLGGFLSCAVAI